MDSGNNSGSLPSSSGGGDDEFDSVRSPAEEPLSLPPNPFFFDTISYNNPFLFFDASTSSWPPIINGSPSITSSTASIAAAAVSNSQTAAASPPARNSKKRSRASRRAPTTVLTTDTSNFRAMVQEFTGIPSTPFSRPRLDLFSSSASSSSSFLLRPFAQKLHPSSSPLTTTAAATSINYQLPRDRLGVGMHNPLLQTPTNPTYGFTSGDVGTISTSPTIREATWQTEWPMHALGSGSTASTAARTINFSSAAAVVPPELFPAKEPTETVPALPPVTRAGEGIESWICSSD